jgi:endoglucanase
MGPSWLPKTIDSLTTRLRGRKPVLYTSVLATLLAIAAAFSIPSLSVNQSAETPAAAAKASGYQMPLSAKGGKIVDARGQEVVLTGVNWFGLETGTFAPHGIWQRNWQEMLDQMVKQGFNTMRLPYSNEIFSPKSKPTEGVDFKMNPDLRGLNGEQIMDKIVNGATSRGMMVFLDRHRPDQYGQSPLWYTEKVSEETWIKDWVKLAAKYKNNPLVIGGDLHNEPRGEATWGDGNAKTDWKAAAERAGNAILKANPNWLIIVEGIETYGKNGKGYWWGGNLQGAKEHPVQLSDPSKLVYSAHDYSPKVWGQSWFSDPTFPKNMPALWDQQWGYLVKSKTAPVIMGEFGGRSVSTKDAEGVWQTELIKYLKANKISYTYWAWNPNSGDTGGIVNDDWTTINKDKMELLKSYQAPMAQKPTSKTA